MLKLPANIENEMRMFRFGATWNVPQSYIDFHKEKALADLDKRDWALLSPVELVDDGWCDGAKFIQVHVLVDDTEMILKWHESGAWFKHCESGGSVREFEMIQ